MYAIGQQVKVNGITNPVVIRKSIANGKFFTVSLGFDTKGNDITSFVRKEDII